MSSDTSMLFLDPGLNGTSGFYIVSAQTFVESQTHNVSLNNSVHSLPVYVRLLISYFSNHFLLVPQYIVQCWGFLICSDHHLYSYSTEDAIRIGNSFITILNHT
jgi:hypothetical protein